MITIALTGGIGSGKSTVAEILHTMGHPVYDSDNAAKRLYNSDSILQNDLIRLFGAAIYQDGKIDLPQLAKFVFQDSALLNRLNACVHPAVARDFHRWSLQQTSEMIVFETALLEQAASIIHFDKTVVVTAPLSLRLERVMHRSHLSEKEILDRIHRQISEDILLEKADFVIHNGANDALIPQLLIILKQLYKPN